MNTERKQILNDLVLEKNVFIRFDTTVSGNLTGVLRYLAEAAARASGSWPDGKPGDLCRSLRNRGLRYAYIEVYLSTTPRYALWEEEPEKGHTIFDHVDHLKDLEGPRPTRAHIVCQNDTDRYLILKLLEREGYENLVLGEGISNDTTVINVERRKVVSYQTPNVNPPGMEINHPLSNPEETLRKLNLLVNPLPELSPKPCEGLLCITEKDILQDLGEFYIRVPLKNPVYIEEAAAWLEDHGFNHDGGLPPDQLFELDHVRGSSFIFLQCYTETHSFNVLVCGPYGRGLGELPEAKYYVRNKVEARNKERTKQLQHGQQLAERLRRIADSIEGSGVVDASLNLANTGITPLHDPGYGPFKYLDLGSRRLELNYIVPKN